MPITNCPFPDAPPLPAVPAFSCDPSGFFVPSASNSDDFSAGLPAGFLVRNGNGLRPGTTLSNPDGNAPNAFEIRTDDVLTVGSGPAVFQTVILDNNLPLDPAVNDFQICWRVRQVSYFSPDFPQGVLAGAVVLPGGPDNLDTHYIRVQGWDAAFSGNFGLEWRAGGLVSTLSIPVSVDPAYHVWTVRSLAPAGNVEVLHNGVSVLNVPRDGNFPGGSTLFPYTGAQRANITQGPDGFRFQSAKTDFYTAHTN